MATWKMAVVGLEGREHALLETAIDLASGIETGRWELVKQLEMAQVILANFDSPEGLETSNQVSSEANIFVVPYSADDLLDDYKISLKPPLSYKNVTTLLKNLETELVSPAVKKPVEEQKPQPSKKSPLITEANIQQINPADIVKHKIDWLTDGDTVEFTEAPILSEIEIVTSPFDIKNEPVPINQSTKSFTPNSRLLGVIQAVIDSGKTTLIDHPDYPKLRIFPDNGWFVFSDELDSFPEMFREPSASFSLTVLNEEIKDELFSGRLPQSLWKLLYTAALFGSEGSILEHLDQNEPFHLIHTPYFGMIPHTSDHMTIAEFMVNNNSDIESISNSTNIDIETVIDFCNACDAIQVLRNGETMEQSSSEVTDFTGVENDTTVESVVVHDTDKPRKAGLINSLLSNLTKSS